MSRYRLFRSRFGSYYVQQRRWLFWWRDVPGWRFLDPFDGIRAIRGISDQQYIAFAFED